MSDSLIDYFTKMIAADIVLSDDLGSCLRKWLNLFNLSQTDVSEHLGVGSSVISDYLRSRRKSPGILWIKNYIRALIELEEINNFTTLSILAPVIKKIGSIDPIITAIPFISPLSLTQFCDVIKATILFPFRVENELEIYILGILGIDAHEILERYTPNFKGNSLEIANIAIMFENTQTGRGIFSILPKKDPMFNPVWVFPEKRINSSIINNSVRKLRKAKVIILSSEFESIQQVLSNLA
ncbi:MAG: hypothetical protein ACFFCQ_00235 [Promethearchaeota archaeon]